MKKRIAIMLLLLIVLVPLEVSMSLAQPTDLFEGGEQEEFDEREGFELIDLNVKQYEPTVLSANLVEQDDASVFVLLEGNTIGSVSAPDILTSTRINVGGLEEFALPPIKDIDVKEVEREKSFVRSVRWVRPRAQLTLDNLGYLIVRLKRIEKEDDVPDIIRINLTAEVEFDADRGFGIGRQTLILGEEPNEDEWKRKLNSPESAGETFSESQFFSGTGFLRASAIDDDSVKFVLYEGERRTTARGRTFPVDRRGTFTLKEGQTSGSIRSRALDDLLFERFRIRLDDIIDLQKDVAKISVNINGIKEDKVLTEGMQLFSGSDWRVRRILKETIGGKIVESVELERVTDGERKKITREFDFRDELLESVVPKSALKSMIENQKKSLDVKVGENVYTLVFYGSKVDTLNVGTIDRLITGANLRLLELAQLMGKGFLEVEKVPGRVIDKIKKDGASFGVEIKDKKGEILRDLAYTAVKEAELSFCENVENKLLPDFEKLNDDNEKIKAYCEAIRNYDELIGKYGDLEIDNVPYREIAYKNKADALMEIANIRSKTNKEEMNLIRQEALRIYNLVSHPSLMVDVGEKIKLLEDMAQDNVINSPETIEERNNIIEVQLLGVRPSTDAVTTAKISIDGGAAEEFKEGELLLGLVERDSLDWRIKDIKRNSVVVERSPVREIDGERTGRVQLGLSLNRGKNIDRNKQRNPANVKVVDTNLNRQAVVTILPGSGRTVSSLSNLELRIPVEKRAIKFTPKNIEKQIKTTEEIIEDLNKIIDKLEDVVRTWKIICLSVFGFFTLKNSFWFGSAEKIKARRQVLDDPENGWRAYCSKNTGPGKLYSSFDNCIIDNTDAFLASVEKVQNANEKAESLFNKDMKEITVEDEKISLENVRAYEERFNEKILPDEEVKEFLRAQSLMEQCKGFEAEKDAGGRFKPSMCIGIENKFQNSKARLNDVENEFEHILNELSNKDNTLDERQKEEFKIFLENRPDDWIKFKAEKDKEVKNVNDFFAERAKAVEGIRNEARMKNYVKNKVSDGSIKTELIEVKKGDEVKYFWQTPHGPMPVEKTGEKYKVNILGESYAVNRINAKDAKLEVDNLLYNNARTGGTVKLLTEDGGFEEFNFKVEDGRHVITSSGSYENLEFNPGSEVRESFQKRLTYAKGATLECTSEGKPRCIPTGKGDYVQVISYSNTGIPLTMRRYNVGPDGMLCTRDDAPVGECDVLDAVPRGSKDLRKCQSIYSSARSEVLRAEVQCNNNGRFNPEGVFTKDGQKFKTSTNFVDRTTPKVGGCTDVMDPLDCRILFGVCDPVMCPASRFNLGGYWQVGDVIRTGMIGSLVLGLHNFDVPYEPVPICISGVLAGLKNLRSVFEGYTSCLKTQLVKGESVGICDKIRSVFICQILYRELIAILNVREGILNTVFNKVFGVDSPVPEYLNLEENLNNIGNSVNFFTQSYARTAFAAFEGKSLAEIGGEICKAAVFGSIPGVSDAFDQLLEPEDPPQFTAFFEEIPYSSTGDPRQRRSTREFPQSQYNVFYHIYAGSPSVPATEEITYSVFLRDVNGRVKYFTEECDQRRGEIPKGELRQISKSCTADAGFTEICVVINGRQECGFGKVTTSFALNYVNDLLVQGEAEKQIKTEEQCVADKGGIQANVPAIGARPGIGSSVPVFGGFTRTGIVRVCSSQNPGAGTNQDRWRKVGTCGNDKIGRFLGDCWLDLNTVPINELSRRQETFSNIDNIAKRQALAERGITTADEIKQLEEEGKNVLALAKVFETDAISKGKCNDYKNSIDNYRKALTNDLLSSEEKAGARKAVADLYLKLARDGCSGKVEEEKKQAEEETAESKAIAIVPSYDSEIVIETSQEGAPDVIAAYSDENKGNYLYVNYLEESSSDEKEDYEVEEATGFFRQSKPMLNTGEYIISGRGGYLLLYVFARKQNTPLRNFRIVGVDAKPLDNVNFERTYGKFNHWISPYLVDISNLQTGSFYIEALDENGVAIQSSRFTIKREIAEEKTTKLESGLLANIRSYGELTTNIVEASKAEGENNLYVFAKAKEDDAQKSFEELSNNGILQLKDNSVFTLGDDKRFMVIMLAGKMGDVDVNDFTIQRSSGRIAATYGQRELADIGRGMNNGNYLVYSYLLDLGQSEKVTIKPRVGIRELMEFTINIER